MNKYEIGYNDVIDFCCENMSNEDDIIDVYEITLIDELRNDTFYLSDIKNVNYLFENSNFGVKYLITKIKMTISEFLKHE